MFEKINSKVVRAALAQTGPIVARKGAMLCYTGQVFFQPHQVGGIGGQGVGSGLAGMAGRMVRGEHEKTMLAQGNGEVTYGYKGLAVHPVTISPGAQLSADMSRLLGYTASLQASIISTGQAHGGGGGLRGALRGAVTGDGMFTTQLTGQGAAVLLAHGEILEIPVNGQYPVVVDPQAFVGSIGQVQVQLQSAMGWRDAVGRGSGEGLQLQISGNGVVFVQASEEKL